MRANPYSDLSKRIYFSFWSWALIKNCPHSFYLNVIKKVDRPQGQSKHNAIQGGVPDAMATDFFKLPKQTRDMNFFIERFQHYWDLFLKENAVDFLAYARQYAKSKRMQLPTEDEDNLREFGMKLKYDETKESTSNLMRLLSHMNIHKMDVETQVSFNITLEPAIEKGNMFQPELAIGGRIDMVVTLDANTEEIWDVKAVKSPNNLDSDQLLMYKMGRQAAGKTVKRVGYLHAKQCKAETKKFLPVHEDRLKKLMRQAQVYFKNDSWPANYQEWSCGYCDVRTMCDTFKRRTSGSPELINLIGGTTKVDL